MASLKIGDGLAAFLGLLSGFLMAEALLGRTGRRRNNEQISTGTTNFCRLECKGQVIDIGKATAGKRLKIRCQAYAQGCT